ncbi:TlpA family protein disulfide reductase [Nonomuraea basaltis]|uniref:TlpA family protein disulfide reductase n=1 Tax=Nonomuraea basaltis TaxID=2495887 RepID=UPI00110C6E99|nr:redoxin domain-containing protein [Nonomuraea basaltis]TMR94975.1 redoxin domain-containing protein [Nonomuraea basaltis]
MLKVRAVAVLVSAALLATACAGPGEGTAPADSARIDPSATSAAPSSDAATEAPAASDTSAPEKAAAPEALKFSAKTLDGKEFKGETLAGKPVVFWFWAPWCPKCLSEAPHVKAAAAEYGDVAFVGVAGLDTEAAMKEFVQRTGTSGFTQLSDEKGAVWTKLGVSAQSTFVFMKPDGTTAKASGPLGKEQLDDLVRTLMDG